MLSAALNWSSSDLSISSSVNVLKTTQYLSLKIFEPSVSGFYVKHNFAHIVHLKVLLSFYQRKHTIDDCF